MSQINFDPQTGEPLHGNAVPGAGAPAPAPKKSSTGKIIAIVVAAALVIGGGAFAARSLKGAGSGGAGEEGTPYEQIKAASEVTFASDEASDQLKAGGEITRDGTYAIDATGSVSGQNVKVDYDTDQGKTSIALTVAGFGGTVYLDDTKITVEAPKLGLDAMSYDYTADKDEKSDSYIVKMAGADTLKQVDSVIKMAYAACSSNRSQEEVQKLADEKVGGLEYAVIEPETVKVGGSDVECGGFSTTVSGEFIADLLDEACEKMYGKSLTDLTEQLSSISASTSEAQNVLDKIREIRDIDVKFYIDDGKLVQLALKTAEESEEAEDSQDSSGDSVQDIDFTASFAGEDIPWHDTVIVNNKSGETVTLKGVQDGDQISYELKSADSDTAALDYNLADGAFVFSHNGETKAKGKIETGDVMKISIDEISGQKISSETTISDNVDVKDAPEGARDVLTMTENDFSALASLISKMMYGGE